MEKLYKLFRLQCQDLLVLADMEYAGLYFNVSKAREHSTILREKQAGILLEFSRAIGSDLPSACSPSDLSVVLYGGIIREKYKLAVGHYKSGIKKGEIKYQNAELEHEFPRLVQPLKKTDTAKSKKRIADGTHTEESEWGVSEPTLKSLKANKKAKEIIDIILELRSIEKLTTTYLEGYTKLIKEKHWEGDVLHPSYNQCMAITGRLSSSSPNAQNMDKETKYFIESSYAD